VCVLVLKNSVADCLSETETLVCAGLRIRSLGNGGYQKASHQAPRTGR